jgi:hypothetical protein
MAWLDAKSGAYLNPAVPPPRIAPGWRGCIDFEKQFLDFRIAT